MREGQLKAKFGEMMREQAKRVRFKEKTADDGREVAADVPTRALPCRSTERRGAEEEVAPCRVSSMVSPAVIMSPTNRMPVRVSGGAKQNG